MKEETDMKPTYYVYKGRRIVDPWHVFWLNRYVWLCKEYKQLKRVRKDLDSQSSLLCNRLDKDKAREIKKQKSKLTKDLKKLWALIEGARSEALMVADEDYLYELVGRV